MTDPTRRWMLVDPEYPTDLQKQRSDTEVLRMILSVTCPNSDTKEGVQKALDFVEGVDGWDSPDRWEEATPEYVAEVMEYVEILIEAARAWLAAIEGNDE